MEKKRYELKIADVEMAIISDEREEFVLRLANELDGNIRDMMKANKRCSKLDAAILCGLDYASDKVKAEKRVRNLEAQVALYDANIRRLREEVARLKGEIFVCPAPRAAAEPASDDIADLEAIDGAEEVEITEETEIQVEITEEVSAVQMEMDMPEEETTEAEAESEEAEAEEASDDSDKIEKIRRVEELLRRRNDGEEKVDESRENKLRQIENLLRNK